MKELISQTGSGVNEAASVTRNELQYRLSGRVVLKKKKKGAGKKNNKKGASRLRQQPRTVAESVQNAPQTERQGKDWPVLLFLCLFTESLALQEE